MTNLVEINREQLRERVDPIVDDHFIHCHWNSQRALVSFIPPTALTMLDLGCGPIADIVDLLPDMDYTGVDFVPEYIAGLQWRSAAPGPFRFTRRRFVLASMDALPLPDASYDVVYSRHTLEHVPDLKRALAEAARVLKPGGRFIFCVPADPGDTEPAHITRWAAHRWLSAIGSVVNIQRFGQHDYFINEVYGYGVKPGGRPEPARTQVRRMLRRFYHLRGYSLIWPLRRAL